MINKKDKFTIAFAFVVAGLMAIHFFLNSSAHGQTTAQSIIKALSVSIPAFIFILIAYFSGGRHWRKGQMIVSPWFGVFVAGSFFLFWMGGIYMNNLYYGGLVTVILWGGIVLSTWVITKIIKQRRQKA
jgi:hypothetical protein